MITSRSNRWIKDIRRSHRSKDAGRLVLEGPHLLEEALRSPVELEAVLATEEFLSGATGRRLAESLPFPPLRVDPGLLAEVSDVETSRGVVAMARRLPVDPEVLATTELVLVVDGVQDPGNLGALARVGEAAGVGVLAIGIGSARPEHPRALRGSAGSLLRLPVVPAADVPDSGPRRWIGLEAHGGKPLWEADLDGPLAVVAGGEGAGLGPESSRRLDEGITIPLEAGVESLNVAVATGIVLFERLRRRRAARGAGSG